MSFYNKFHELPEKTAALIYGTTLVVVILILKLVFKM